MILVVGSINMDICLRVQDIPRPGETVLSQSISKNPGGKGANQAVAAAKLGGEVVMLGCVGNDEHGGMLLHSLRSAGVDTQHILIRPGCASSSAFICVADSGENAIVVDSSANMFVSPEYLLEHEQLFRKAEFCVLQMEIPSQSVRTAMQLSKKHGTKVVLNPSPLSGFDKSLLHGVDVLIPNESEAAALMEGQDFEAFMAHYGITEMIVTLGSRGCMQYGAQGEPRFSPSAPRKAVDTTGAGDTFLGAFVAALSANLPDALAFANTAAGIAVTRRGAQQAMPTLDEVMREMNAQAGA